MFPALEAGEPSGGEILPDVLEDFLAGLEPAKSRAFKTVLTVFELGALPRYGRGFSALGQDKRDVYLTSWMRSRLAPRRIIYRTLRDTFGMLFYQDDRTWGSIGYRGPTKPGLRNG